MSTPSGRKAATLTIAGVIVAAAFGYLMFGGLESNVVYFLTPAELIGRGDAVYDQAVRLGGQVAPGSVQWDAKALDLRFRVREGTHEVVVHSKGAPPQMFRDGMGVVVEGKFRRVSGGEAVFESKNLMIKHSEEYRAPKDGKMPQEMYRSLIKGVSS
jgi:cytochrome c-type biogenesis protein CcmE